MLLIALLNVDAFTDIRKSLASLLLVVLGIVSMIALVVVAFHIFNGDREAAKKASVWLVMTILGFTLISLFGSV